MTGSGGMFAEAPPSWLSLFCAPLASCLDRRPRRSKSKSLTATSISWPLGRSSDQELLIDQEDDEKEGSQIIYEQHRSQPHPQPAVLPAYQAHAYATSEAEKPPRKSFASSRTVRSMRNRFRSDGSRRPQISGPTDFRHLDSASFMFPPPDSSFPQPRPSRPARPSSYRPLELSIYMPNNRMSPLLPHFEFPGTGLIEPPQPAYLVNRVGDGHQLIRQRSSPSMSFHLPRHALADRSPSRSGDEAPPGIPPRAPARARAYTSPEVDSLKARVASAMIEVEKLQQQIDDVVERQSICLSRPSTAHSMAFSTQMPEPMPDIPALPPAAPSFAERLHSERDRPRTASIDSPVELVAPNQDGYGVESTVSTPTQARHIDLSRPLPPPLPLVLRPPLRKKKSFSRVSTWLFPDGRHGRDLSIDSVTNLPRPVKGTEGFYQCVPAGSTSEKRSFESVGTVTTWDSDDGQRTVPTTWSPGSTPVAKKESSLDRTATFGKTR